MTRASRHGVPIVLSALLTATLASASEVPGLEDPPVRVEPRLLVKAGRLFLAGGGAQFFRFDYFSSPGVVATAAWYASEANGFELKLTALFPRMDGGAEEVQRATGLVPDAQRPRVAALAGWRHAFGYGKLLVGSTVVHFDLHGSPVAGAIWTDRQISPALGIAPGVLVRISDTFALQLDLAALASLERREGSDFVFGLMPQLTAGGWL